MGPYTNEQQINDLVAANDQAALQALSDQYMVFFKENQCELPDTVEAWGGLGEYFLGLARSGSHGVELTREEFVAAVEQFIKQPIPTWIRKVHYIQTDLAEGTYYLALPPKELAEQAWLHGRNPKAASADYVMPPIYLGFDDTVSPQGILAVRIADYTISHCG